MKDWRVTVEGNCVAEVIEFDSYREAWAYCNEHRTSDDPLHVVELIDFRGRLVWTTETGTISGADQWSIVVGVADLPEGFYRYSQDIGWWPIKGGAGVQPQ
jgi:hypothetical protein